MSSVASSDLSNASMQKWGIPADSGKTDESSVLERLVWVQYNEKWWPAILYRSYLELQQHMYTRFSSYVVKAQFALAIMRQMQETRNVKVARLLGRDSLEIIEVDDGAYREFYWYLADILPEVCDQSNFEGELDLFIDVHRALDEVETIFREVANCEVPLSLEDDEHQTWLERAQAKILDETASPLSLSGRGGSGCSRGGQNDHDTGNNDRSDDKSIDSIRRIRPTLGRNDGRNDWSYTSALSSTPEATFSKQRDHHFLSKNDECTAIRQHSSGIFGDETREDVLSMSSTRSSQKRREPAALLSYQKSGSDVVAEMISSIPSSSNIPIISSASRPLQGSISIPAISPASRTMQGSIPSSVPYSVPSPVINSPPSSVPNAMQSSLSSSSAPSGKTSQRKREMFPKLLEEIDKLQKAVDTKRERRKKKNNCHKSKAHNSTKNCARTYSTMSAIRSQLPPSTTTAIAAPTAGGDTDKVKYLASSEAEPLRTSKGRIIPRRRGRHPSGSPPMANDSRIDFSTQQHLLQGRNQEAAAYTMMDAQSLLMEAQHRQKNSLLNSRGRTEMTPSASSQRCHAPFCGM